MINDPYKIYDVLAAGVKSSMAITACHNGGLWAGVEAGEHFGIAMSTPGDTVQPMYPQLMGLSLKEAARAAASWNLSEASLGLAAVNAFYNTAERLEALDCAADLTHRVTDGIDFSGKTVGVIGHMHVCDEMWQNAAQIYRLERTPRTGDYPDSACDFILPACDIVVITGSSIINKTLPHLLELCPGAIKILTGPSVPLCPELFDLGIDRISGLVITNCESMRSMVVSGEHGSPMKNGTMFILKK